MKQILVFLLCNSRWYSSYLTECLAKVHTNYKPKDIKKKYSHNLQTLL